MAIRTSVSVRDNMSAAFLGITGAINTCLDTFMQLQNSTDEGLNDAQFSAIQSSMYELSEAAHRFGEGLDDAGNEQKKLNNSMKQGVSSADGLLGKVKGIVAAYAGWKTIVGGVNLSDDFASASARLNMLNGDLVENQNKIMSAAQRSRGAYLDMAGAVAKFGINAGQAFGNDTDQIIAFTELIQKQFKIAGASTQESANAMLQLTQAMASGALRGEELNSILDQGPGIVQNIADYLEVDRGKIKELAEEGKLTADVVKNAMFAAADEINANFDSMPRRWADVWNDVKNTAIGAFQPLLQKINDIANSERFNHVMDGLINGINTTAVVATSLFDSFAQGASFVYDNWSVIEPIFWGIVTAVGAYATIQAICAGVSGAMALAEGVRAAATAMAGGATFIATVQQQGLNAALLACPVTWIVVGIIALVAATISLCQWIANTTGVAGTLFGVMMGGVFVVGSAFKNFGLLVANIALGIWDAIGACCTNIGVAFYNAISGAISWWYDLLSTALTVVSGICEALNKLPFVEFDYSGITNKASEYAQKSAIAAGLKMEYTDVGAAFDKGFGTFDAFKDGWASDAFSDGAKWGDNISNKVSGAIDGLMNFDTGSIFSQDALNGTYGADTLGNIADATGTTADNTGKALEITEENLAWMKDIAEREVIDRTVFKDISVSLGGVNNTVNNMSDLDGIADYLGNVIQEQMLISAEGVHA